MPGRTVRLDVPEEAAATLLTLLKELELNLRGPASVQALSSIRLAELLPVQLRSTPLFRAEESPHNLCAARPPYGLLGDPSQLGAGAANVSKLRGAARAAAHVALCKQFAEDLLRRRRGANGMPPRLFPPNASCAVVGSGGTLSRSRSGADIDAHDVVMRFNAAPTGGEWAVDVGSRTTLRIFTDKTFQSANAINDGTRFGAHRRSKGVRSKTADGAAPGRSLADGAASRRAGERRAASVLYCMAAGWVGKCMHAPSLWHVNPVFVRHLRAHLDENQGRGRLPSAGLLGMAAALTRCSRVSIYGFGNASDVADGPGAAACGHYWECSRQQGKYFGGKAGYHDWKAQWRVLSGWITNAASLGRASHDLVFHPGSGSRAAANASEGSGSDDAAAPTRRLGQGRLPS